LEASSRAIVPTSLGLTIPEGLVIAAADAIE
jgi:hypothetical protein